MRIIEQSFMKVKMFIVLFLAIGFLPLIAHAENLQSKTVNATVCYQQDFAWLPSASIKFTTDPEDKLKREFRTLPANACYNGEQGFQYYKLICGKNNYKMEWRNCNTATDAVLPEASLNKGRLYETMLGFESDFTVIAKSTNAPITRIVVWQTDPDHGPSVVYEWKDKNSKLKSLTKNITVKNLKPNTGYVFDAMVFDSKGHEFPTPLSLSVNTPQKEGMPAIAVKTVTTKQGTDIVAKASLSGGMISFIYIYYSSNDKKWSLPVVATCPINAESGECRFSMGTQTKGFFWASARGDNGNSADSLMVYSNGASVSYDEPVISNEMDPNITEFRDRKKTIENVLNQTYTGPEYVYFTVNERELNAYWLSTTYALFWKQKNQFVSSIKEADLLSNGILKISGSLAYGELNNLRKLTGMQISVLNNIDVWFRPYAENGLLKIKIVKAQAGKSIIPQTAVKKLLAGWGVNIDDIYIKLKNFTFEQVNVSDSTLTVQGKYRVQ